MLIRLSAPRRHGAGGAVIINRGHPYRSEGVVGSEIDNKTVGQAVMGGGPDVLKTHPENRPVGIGYEAGPGELAAEIQNSDIGLGCARGNSEIAINVPPPSGNQDMHEEEPSDAIDVNLELRRVQIREEFAGGIYRHIEDFFFHLVKTPAGRGECNRGFYGNCYVFGST